MAGAQAVAPASIPSEREGNGRRVEGAIFRRKGEYWAIAYEGEEVLIKDIRGLGYLAQLLASPGRKFHALEMAQAVDAGPDESVDSDSDEDDEAAATEHSSRSGLEVRGDFGDAGEMLDEQAKTAYRRRREELREELEEAREFRNEERIARAENEMDALERELARAVGLGGRDRRAASASERARLNVTRAIKAALERIADQHPSLARHLSATIRTGTFCSYSPDPRTAVSWQL